MMSCVALGGRDHQQIIGIKLSQFLRIDAIRFHRLARSSRNARRGHYLTIETSIDLHLLQWVKRKYRKRGRYLKRAKRWLAQVARYQPLLFAHWRLARPGMAE